MLFRNHTAGWHLPAIILREKLGISGRSGNLPLHMMQTCTHVSESTGSDIQLVGGWPHPPSSTEPMPHNPARSILNLVDISWNRSSRDSRFHNCYLHLPKTTVYCIITRWQWGWSLFLLMAMSGLATNFTISLDGWMGIYTPCFQVARCRWWTWNHGTDPKLQGDYFQYDESFHTYGAVSQIKCFISDGFLCFEWNWQSFTGKNHMTHQLQY